MPKKKEIVISCAFCSQNSSGEIKMIVGPNNVAICEECVRECNKVLSYNAGVESGKKLNKEELIELMSNMEELKTTFNKLYRKTKKALSKIEKEEQTKNLNET